MSKFLYVQMSLALCLSELIRITAPNSPFEDELMKKVFRVNVSSFEALLDRLTNHTITDFAYLST